MVLDYQQGIACRIEFLLFLLNLNRIKSTVPTSANQSSQKQLLEKMSAGCIFFYQLPIPTIAPLAFLNRFWELTAQHSGLDYSGKMTRHPSHRSHLCKKRCNTTQTKSKSKSKLPKVQRIKEEQHY